MLAESTRVEGRGDTSFAFDLARETSAAGTYPIVLVSYQMACSKYQDQAQADLVKGFLTYTTSAEGQKAGSRPPDRRRCPSSCARRSARRSPASARQIDAPHRGSGGRSLPAARSLSRRTAHDHHHDRDRHRAGRIRPVQQRGDRVFAALAKTAES